MTKEEKDILLKDLCARLPYKLHCRVFKLNEDIKENDDILYGVIGDNVVTLKSDKDECLMYYQIKPYLRPMQSMTKGEKEEYRKLCKKVVRKLYVADGKSWPSNKTSYRYFGTKTEYYDTYQSIDYLISRHFDYRGLIGKKLALKATNGMYK